MVGLWPEASPEARALGHSPALDPVAAPRPEAEARTHCEPVRAGYLALIVFLLVYCARPEDWIPGLAALHLDRVAGGLAIAAAGLSALSGRQKLRLSRSMYCLILLFGQLLLAAAFSPIWRGGAMDLVVNQFSKAVLIALVITWVATTARRLQTLLFVQAVTVVIIGVVSAYKFKTVQGRLEGVLGGGYANSNDLALALAIAIPLCFAFLFLSKRWIWKLGWLAAIGVLIYAVTLTFSRGGLLSVLVALGVCIWEFGIRGKRSWLPVSVVAGVLLLLLAAPSGYGGRVATIFQPDTDATGSAQQRMGLQERSFTVTLEHPLLGVGPGNFMVISGNWHVTHNSFTQLSSEGGIPALILYLMILVSSFKGLRSASRATKVTEVRVLARALRASLAAFVVRSLFASVAYLFFPYLMFGYAVAFQRVAQPPKGGDRNLQCAG